MSSLECSGTLEKKNLSANILQKPEFNSETIKNLVMEAATACFLARETARDNAVLIEREFDKKKFVILGTLEQLSEKDIYWNRFPRSIDKIYFVVHVLIKIGTGNVKEAYKCLKSYQIEAEGTEFKVSVISDVAQYAFLILKTETSRIANELNLLKTLSHPNIIRLISDFKILYTQDTLLTKTILVEEWMMGDLSQIYRDDNIVISLEQARKMVAQIISALKYLSKQKIVHPDIKPANCLFTRINDEIVIKIADLEGCFHFQKGKESSNYTPSVAAPELIAKFAYLTLKESSKKTFSQEISETYTSFRKNIPSIVDFQHINQWGAGILIHEIYLKLLGVKSTIGKRYPWQTAMLQINRWAFPGLYKNHSITFTDLANYAEEAARGFDSFELEKCDHSSVKVIGEIAFCFLRKDPDQRILFEEAEEWLSSQEEPLIAKRKIEAIESKERYSKKIMREEDVEQFLIPGSSIPKPLSSKNAVLPKPFEFSSPVKGSPSKKRLTKAYSPRSSWTQITPTQKVNSSSKSFEGTQKVNSASVTPKKGENDSERNLPIDSPQKKSILPRNLFV